MEKLSWHTDIVVNGQGIGLSLKKGRDGCYVLSAMPDVPGLRTKKAFASFKKALDAQPGACSAAQAKRKVSKAVKATGAKWNKWHREAYKK